MFFLQKETHVLIIRSRVVLVHYFQKPICICFQVLIKEIGSEKGVQRALKSESDWEGRASMIASLKAQLDKLKHAAVAAAANSDHSPSSSPKLRGTGDGSSRQGSLTPTNTSSADASGEDHSAIVSLDALKIKFEEEATIRKVSEVERERLGLAC